MIRRSQAIDRRSSGDSDRTSRATRSAHRAHPRRSGRAARSCKRAAASTPSEGGDSPPSCGATTARARETFDPRQLLLFGQRIEQLPLDEASIEEEAGEQLVTRRVRTATSTAGSSCPSTWSGSRSSTTCDEKACPACGRERCRIGAESQRAARILPGQLQGPQARPPQVRLRASATTTATTRTSPRRPSRRSRSTRACRGRACWPTSSTSKLGDHLPLYRLEHIFARQQVHVARSTMCAWMRAAGELVAPLVELMTARVKQSRVIHTDDTPVPIQSPGREAVPQGAHLVLPGRRGESVHGVRLHARPRSRDGPAGGWPVTVNGPPSLRGVLRGCDGGGRWRLGVLGRGRRGCAPGATWPSGRAAAGGWRRCRWEASPAVGGARR